MVNESMREMGHTRSCIRELFEYGKKQAAIVGKENVFDFSIGNPSIPAPEEVNEAIINAVETLDSITIHGYTSFLSGIPRVHGTERSEAGNCSAG